ncbi:MAG: nucleotidyltransferase domain-containing protein [Chitinophagaceae bacterium]|jgi:predicted nucleotidyltransferase|nr:MAG: nucleotidyltransferase domain-containing protein [Chitinophagaceae bacterium]
MVEKSVLKVANQFIKQIPKDMGLQSAYLFGSHAKGMADQDSDIDIALIMSKMDNFFSVQMRLMRLRRNIDLRIEPHPIEEKDFTEQNPFASQIKKSGIQLNKSS